MPGVLGPLQGVRGIRGVGVSVVYWGLAGTLDTQVPEGYGASGGIGGFLGNVGCRGYYGASGGVRGSQGV